MLWFVCLNCDDIKSVALQVFHSTAISRLKIKYIYIFVILFIISMILHVVKISFMLLSMLICRIPKTRKRIKQLLRMHCTDIGGEVESVRFTYFDNIFYTLWCTVLPLEQLKSHFYAVWIKWPLILFNTRLCLLYQVQV